MKIIYNIIILVIEIIVFNYFDVSFLSFFFLCRLYRRIFVYIIYLNKDLLCILFYNVFSDLINNNYFFVS